MKNYKYALKKAVLRSQVDLSNHEIGIKEGVNSMFQDVLNCKVYSSYFEFDLPEAVASPQLRVMGKNIARSSQELGALVETYEYENNDGSPGISKQLFVLMKPRSG